MERHMYRAVDANPGAITDLLSLLKRNGEAGVQPSGNGDCWGTYNYRGTYHNGITSKIYSLTDISANNIANRPKATVGWKVVDGKKTYTTFRAGKLIKAEGHEAFKLAMSDGNAAPSKKGEKEQLATREVTEATASKTNKENNVPVITGGTSSKLKKRTREPEKEIAHSKKASIQSFFAATVKK